MAAENKRRRRKAIHKLDQGAIRMLQKFQERHGCDLEPNVEKEPCISCSNREKCLRFRWERKYIKKTMQ